MRPRRERVLVVDDAANLRELLTVLLDVEDDFEVVGTAADGVQALDRADALEPDIVLRDLGRALLEGGAGHAAHPALSSPAARSARSRATSWSTLVPFSM